MIGPPIPEIVQVATQVAPTAAGPYWWAQPVATLIAAAAAYYGIRNAIRIHRESVAAQEQRMICDQLEKRAKERERLLQDIYTDFIDCAYNIADVQERLAFTEEVSKQKIHHELQVTLNQQKQDELYAALLTLAPALRRTIARMKLVDFYNYNRVDDAVEVEGLLLAEADGSLTQHEKRREILHRFTERVAEEIDQEYQIASRLARRGQIPARPERWSDSPPCTAFIPKDGPSD